MAATGRDPTATARRSRASPKRLPPLRPGRGETFDAFALRTLRYLYATNGDVDPRSALAKRTYSASLLAADAEASLAARRRGEPWGPLLAKRHGQEPEPVVGKAFAVIGPAKATVTLTSTPSVPATASLERVSTRSETIVYSFVPEGGSWQVDDMSYLDGRGLEVADARFLAFMETSAGKPLVVLPVASGLYGGDTAEFSADHRVPPCGAVVVGTNGRDLHLADPTSGKADTCVTDRLGQEGDGHGLTVSSTCASRSVRRLTVLPLTRTSLLFDRHVYKLCGTERSALANLEAATSGMAHTAPQKRIVDLSREEGTEAFVHNGSVVNVSTARGLITYREPAAAMKVLVHANDVLFFSGVIGPATSDGTAYLFKSGCPPLGFHVTGTGDTSTGYMVLTGMAPVRTGSSCDPPSGATRKAVLRFEAAGPYFEARFEAKQH